VRAAVPRLDEPLLLPDEHGEVAVYGLPFLEPEVARFELGVPGARSHEAVLDAAMARVRADLARRPGSRSVVLAHAFVGGARPSDSERDICVGGVDLVPPSVFDGVDYVALGHLHRPQTLTPRLRYSGSPLAYSFGEAGQQKQAWLVELDAGGLGAVEFVDAPVPRPLARLRGTLEELLTSADHTRHEGSWVQATLTDPVRPLQAMERLRTRFPHALVLAFDPAGDRPSGPPTVRTEGRSDHAVALDFVEAVRGAAAADDESDLLQRACEACCDDPDVDTWISEAADPVGVPEVVR
jgi:exonuclease SbcD